jgi:DNA repair exonuclease SbcCD ATPase subunit
MASVKLKKISGKGYRSFANEFEVDFPETGLVLVRGINKETGGGSGSGKSNFLAALNQCLDCSQYSGTEVQSWSNETPWGVSLTLETAEGEALIRKGIRPGLVLGGRPHKGGAKIAGEKLRQLLGVDSDVLALLTYRSQKEPGLFLSKADAEKKELLTSLLNLKQFELQIEDSKERCKVLEPRLTALDAQIEYQQKLVDQQQPPVLDVVALRNERDALVASIEAGNSAKKALEAAKSKAKTEALAERILIEAQYRGVEDLESEIEALEQQDTSAPDLPSVLVIERELKDLALAKTTIDRGNEVRLAGLRKEIKTMQDCIAAYDRTIGSANNLLKRRDALAAEITTLNNQLCPTCSRAWTEAQDTISRKQAELDSVESGLANVDVAVAMLPDLKTELSALQAKTLEKAEGLEAVEAQISDAKSRLAAEYAKRESYRQVIRAEINAKVSGLKQKLAETNAEHDADVYKVQQVLDEKIAAIHKKEVVLLGGLNERTAKVLKIETDLRMYDASVAGYTLHIEKLSELKARSEQVRVETNQELDFIDLTKGFLARIFDEVLEQISDVANEILASVANTRHISLEFRSEVETKSGTVQKKIVPVVRLRGQECPITISNHSPRCSGISGGMMTVVELAVDLAVGRIVSERTGVTPGWLILDESFEGLGPVEKESCMEILAKNAFDRLVLVVDHMSEFGSLFTKTITIEYANGCSSIA